MKIKRILLMAALLSGCVLMSAKVALPGIIGDNMVLQQKSQAGIWGWTKPGKEVRLSLIHISEPTRPLYISYAVFCL